MKKARHAGVTGLSFSIAEKLELTAVGHDRLLGLK
jgi:hypothetical protein